MRYGVKACICTNYVQLMDSLDTDKFSEAQEFILQNCRKGYDCYIVDRWKCVQLWAYANDLTEESVNMMDLVTDKLFGGV